LTIAMISFIRSLPRRRIAAHPVLSPCRDQERP